MSRRRSHRGAWLAAGVIIAAGFAVAGVEMSRLPRGSLWLVVAAALLLLLVVRRLGR